MPDTRSHPITESMEIIVAATADYYRRAASERVRGRDMDTVIEIGCSTGKTTRILAGGCQRVIAVDVSREFLDRARRYCEGCSNVTFARVDGRDVEVLWEIAKGRPDAIFIDVGGIAVLENVVAITWLCLRHLQPKRLMVVRNQKLAALTALIGDSEPYPLQARQRSGPRGSALDSLLELSHSTHPPHRLFAARRQCEIRHLEAVRRLEEMCSDPHAQVRRVARRERKPDSVEDVMP